MKIYINYFISKHDGEIYTPEFPPSISEQSTWGAYKEQCSDTNEYYATMVLDSAYGQWCLEHVESYIDERLRKTHAEVPAMHDFLERVQKADNYLWRHKAPALPVYEELGDEERIYQARATHYENQRDSREALS